MKCPEFVTNVLRKCLERALSKCQGSVLDLVEKVRKCGEVSWKCQGRVKKAWRNSLQKLQSVTTTSKNNYHCP